MTPSGLRQRLIFALCAPLILILVVSSLMDYRLARQTADSAHDAALADAVYDLESHFRTHDGTPGDLTEEIEAMIRSSAPDTIYFSVQDAAGRHLAGDTRLPSFAIPPDGRMVFADGFHDGQPVRAAMRHARLRDGDFRILVLETTRKRQQSSHRILTAMIVPNLAVIVATLLAVLFGVRHGLLPLKAVEDAIAARSVHDLREIDLTHTPVEIHPMLQRLNELFGLLREANLAQRRFIADAAHQLRTPLAGLQTQLDLAVGDGIFNGHCERLARIEEAGSRIEHLLNQLLAHARAENPAQPSELFEPVNLESIVENAASLFLDAALAKNIDLGFEIGAAQVKGLPWMLQEAVGNLIDNAIRYTPEGGIITVRCGTDAEGRASIEVEDSGPGIPEDEASRVFERFYRLPGSGGNGCGLGLPIIQEICKLHEASIELNSAVPHGLKAVIRFTGQV